MKVFIGSSTEQKPLAEDLVSFIIQNFGESLQPFPWYGRWPGGQFTLETLLDIADETDASILVLHPDDVACVRGATVRTPRDNLIFEAGLFIARHGPRHARLLVPSDPGNGQVKKPTDIDGLTIDTYDWRTYVTVTFAASGLPTAARHMCTELVRLGPRTDRCEVARAAIVTPLNGSKVEVEEVVTGRSSGVSSRSELWVVVMPIREGRYHPQGGPLTVDGDFTRKVHFGLLESSGHYRLQLVLVHSEDARCFHQYLKQARETQTYRALPALPPRARILDEIHVSRG